MYCKFNQKSKLTLFTRMQSNYINALVCHLYFLLFSFPSFPHMHFKDRDKLQKIHLAEAVEGLKRYNARRKLKGAVQALAGAVSLDSTDSDSKVFVFFCRII